MTLDEVKEFIRENENEEETQAYINSLADKRVNQAREKWERDLPNRLDTMLLERKAREQAEEEKRTNILNELGKHFKENGIQEAWAKPFLPSELTTLQDDEIAPLAIDVVAKVKEYRDSLLLEKYAGTSPVGGGTPKYQDPAEAELRHAMGLK